MVALKLFELFLIIFFVIFLIVLFYAVIRRCFKGSSAPGGKKKSTGVGSSNSDQTNSQAGTGVSQNTQTIYLGTSNQVGNSNGRTIYTIPINSLDLRRTSVVIVRNLNSVSPGNNNIVTLRIPDTIVEEPPPSYEDCVRLPIDSPKPENAGLDIV